MKLLVSSVTWQDSFPTPSAEQSLSFVSSVFKPFSFDGNWPLLPHTAVGLRQACRQGKAAWNCYLLHGLAFWLQTQVTGKARWPLSCAGLGHGRLTLPLSGHARQGWNVHLHTEGERFMCRSETCLLLQCLCQSLPENPCSLDRSHKASLCC